MICDDKRFYTFFSCKTPILDEKITPLHIYTFAHLPEGSAWQLLLCTDKVQPTVVKSPYNGLPSGNCAKV